MVVGIIFTIVFYNIIGISSWLLIECEYRADGHTYSRDGSFMVYLFFWPLLLLKSIIKTAVKAWREY